MNKTFKKSLAAVSAGVIAMGSFLYLNVLAANEPVLVYTMVSGDNTGTDDTLSITIPAGAQAVNGDAISLYVKTGAGAVVDLTGISVDDTDANTTYNAGSSDLANGMLNLTVADAGTAAVLILTFANADLGDGIYSVSYVGTADSAASLFYVNEGNNVVVTAYVAPILTMTLDSNSVDFGQLNVNGNNTSTTDSVIAVSTNAAGGLAISASSVGSDTANTVNALGMPGSTNTIPGIGTKTAVGSLPVGEYFGASVTLNAPSAGATLTQGANFTGGDVYNVDGLLASTSAPTDGASINVTYHAGIDVLTEAGSYASTVTYTVTGSY